MREHTSSSTCARLRANFRRRSGALQQNGNTMSINPNVTRTRQRRLSGNRTITASFTLVSVFLLTLASLTGLTTAAHACACGCSVFDVGGLDLPQEQDHGGRVFVEFWSTNQTQNYVGSARAPAAINLDKNLNTQWYNVGFSYNFNRDWGVMVRVPTANRTLTTDTGAFAGIVPFNVKDIGDIEVMGMYTGFFKDMSTGLLFGLKFPSGPYSTPGLDRDNQIGTGSTDFELGAFHRGLLSGDNAWQYYSQVLGRLPFLYRSAADPQGFFDGNAGVVQTYMPGIQIDGSVGIVYNNLYHVLGLDKITPVAQVIISHREHDSGSGADPFNSGFDRVLLSPGVELTKVVDEANNRVVKLYADVEVVAYYRANAANNNGTEGQLVAPYQIKVVASYNF
jgi:hypothetical protein